MSKKSIKFIYFCDLSNLYSMYDVYLIVYDTWDTPGASSGVIPSFNSRYCTLSGPNSMAAAEKEKSSSFFGPSYLYNYYVKNNFDMNIN